MLDYLAMSEVPLGQLLLRRFRWFDESLRSTLLERGWPHVTPAQSMVFAVIDEAGTSTADLARRIGVTRQAVHQTVKDLEALGLVEQISNPSDGRVRLVRLSEAGAANVQAAFLAFVDIERQLGERIGSQRVSQLRSALNADWGTPGPV